MFWIAASVADAANPNGIKTLFANVVSTYFITGKTAVINGLRKLINLPSGQVFFLVVPLNKIPLFSIILITFIISIISLFVRVIPELLLDVKLIYSFINIIFCYLLANYGAAFFANVRTFFNAFTPKWNIDRSIGPIKSARILPDSIMLDSWVFEHSILADEQFPKALQSLENLCIS